jgi:hypothetical protein
MTAAGIHRPSPGTVPAKALAWPAAGVARMTWLYLISRRIPTALALLAAAGALQWAALDGRWSISGGPAAQQMLPLTIEATAAAVIAVSSYGPFGDTERATGRWLPYLRLSMALALTAAAFGALAAGATGGHFPDGTLAMLRNLAGLTGTGLLASVAFGGAFGWTGPLAYLLLTEGALAGSWTTPWMWPTRPPHDLGAALCAAAVFAAGTAVITIRGGHDHAAR